jgi:hypothetical protein
MGAEPSTKARVTTLGERESELMKNRRQRCVGPEVLPDQGKVKHDSIEEAIQSLARKGLIVDSGRRRWSERTQSYQIAWVAAARAKVN